MHLDDRLIFFYNFEQKAERNPDNNSKFNWGYDLLIYTHTHVRYIFIFTTDTESEKTLEIRIIINIFLNK